MFLGTINGSASGGGGGNIASGTLENITTAQTEVEIPTGVSNIKRFVFISASGSANGTSFIWDKEKSDNPNGNLYTTFRTYNPAAQGQSQTATIGNQASFMTLVSVDESTGVVKIKSGSSSYLPLIDIHWIAEGS